MGGMLTQPVTKKKSDQGEGLGLKYGLSSMQGWRPEMEDAHDVKLGLRYGLDEWSFFAVFDGHAGKCAAAFAAWNLLDYILRDSKFELGTENWPESTMYVADTLNISQELETIPKSSPENSIGDKRKPESDENQAIGQKITYLPISELCKLSTKCPSQETTESKHDGLDTENNQAETVPKPKFTTFPVFEQLDMVKDAIKSGFLRIDQSMRSTAQDMSGCTAVCALVSPTHLFIANCGDSRAVLYDGKLPRFATEDHKPFNPKERKRIVDAGGTATQRINGTLAVSRALGDFEFKKDQLRGPCEQLVSPEPEVTIIERQPTDEFLILACDGIWDVMDNEDLCQYIRYLLTIEPNIENICSSVLDVCLRKGSRDNMSIIIVVFETGPKVSKCEVEQDKQNDEALLKIVDSFQTVEHKCFLTFLNFLKLEVDQQSSKILPPGAGIEAKFDILRDRFDENFEKLQADTFEK